MSIPSVMKSGGPPSAAGKRGSARLSNGDFVEVYLDSNPTGLGDGTNIAKFYIYIIPVATPNATPVLKKTFTPSGSTLQASDLWSIAVDAADNLYLAYVGQTGAALVFTYSGYTAGNWATLDAGATLSSGGQFTTRAIDIDVVGTTPVLGIQLFSTGNSNLFRSWIKRSSDNTWQLLTDQVINTTNAQTLDTSPPNVTITRDTTAAVANEMFFVYAIRGYGSPDPGDVLRYKRVNVSTGAQVSDTLIASGLSSGQDSASRNYMLFSRGDNKFILGYQYNVDSVTVQVLFTYFTRSGIQSSISTSKTKTGSITQASTTFISTQTTVSFVRPYTSGNAFARSAVFLVDDTAMTITDRLAEYDFWEGAGFTPQYMSGGANRNNLTSVIATLWVYGSNNGAYFCYNYVPFTPTDIVPHDATTTNDVTPLLQLLRSTGVESSRAQWDLARDSAFTTSLRTVYDDFSKTTGYRDEYVPNGSSLFTGTWYVRGRLVDPYDLPGLYSTTNSFSVSYPPAAISLSPTASQYSDWGVAGSTTFTWVYSSTALEGGDAQTAYQIIVERNSDGLQIVDTGKIASVAGTAAVTIPATYKDVQLRWKIRLWNRDDAAGSYSAYQLFFVGDKPTVTITTPAAASTVNNPQPTIQWTFASGGGRTEIAYRVTVKQGATTIYDSTWITGSVTSHMLATPVLVNSTAYSVTVEVRDSGNLEKSATNAFTTAWTPPAVPTGVVASATQFDASGYISITFNDSAIRDASWYSYRIYRRVTGATAWELLVELTPSSATTQTYQYYYAPANISYDYVVVQVALRFGSQVESLYTGTAVLNPGGTTYWLLDKTTPSTNSILLTLVTGDSFTDEYDESVLDIIGRGKKIDVGTHWGYVGSLAAQLRDSNGTTARQKRLNLEAMKTRFVSMYLRNPFGDIFEVAVSNIVITRVPGVGTSEFSDVTIPYTQVK